MITIMGINVCRTPNWGAKIYPLFPPSTATGTARYYGTNREQGIDAEPEKEPTVRSGKGTVGSFSGSASHVCSGASCYVWKFFFSFFNVFKIFVKLFVHNEIYRERCYLSNI